MLPLAFYLLKVTICSGILFGYYWFVLRNKIFHQYNRFYLLASVVLSLALPLIQINIWHNAAQPAPQAILLLQAVNGDEYLDEIIVSSRQTGLSFEQTMLMVYTLISIAFLVFFIQALFKIRRLIKKHRLSLFENIYFVNTTAKGTPFSFLKYIFWNDHIDPESTAGSQVFRHEVAHVKERHSYDKLMMHVVLIFCWCNPFFWLVRKELNMIHEFVADQIAVEDNDTAAFAAMILQAAYPQQRFHLANPFFYSPIKRRLMMLTKNRNPKVGYIGRLLVLPLAVLIFAAFTLKAKTFTDNINAYDGKTITVVIDAGHGGSDNGGTNVQGTVLEKDLNLALTKTISALNTNQKIKIILTRETDVFQSVQEKVAFTKAAGADLFISLHMDANPAGQTNAKSGLNVYVANNQSANVYNSRVLASALINEFSQQYGLPVNKQPVQTNMTIRVLQDATCPAVLVEAGNISNSKDLGYLQTKAAQTLVAGKILAAIERWAEAKEKGPTGGGVIALEANAIAPAQKTDTIPEITLANEEKALIIADGKTITSVEMKKIDPETIESITVLKNANAVQEYGEKGKNGVVIIKTKTELTIKQDVNLNIQKKVDSGVQGPLTNLQLSFKNDQTPGNKPLYVVDDKIVEEDFKLNDINPNDIESIHVIKDKSATEKYGDKGVNGVIEISTKVKVKSITITGVGTNTNTNTNSNLNEVVVVGYGVNKNINQETSPIFTKTEKAPAFPGGDSAWTKYLIKNLNANIPVQEGWKPGVYKIVVSFIVRTDGSIADIRTNDYIGSRTSEHCIDLIRKGPKWIPALQNGHAVNSYRKQPITFMVNAK